MKTLLLFFLIIPIKTFAAKGVVFVHELPLFAKPDKTSKILQYAHKGESIYIHNENLHNETFWNEQKDDDKLEVFDYERLEREDYFALQNKYPYENIKKSYFPNTPDQFYKTVSRDGQTAYVPKVFVKIIYNDYREIKENKNLEHDPTDHRIVEPLKDGHPLIKNQGHRAWLIYGSGTQANLSYNYAQTVRNESFQGRHKVGLIWGKKALFDQIKEFYFGVMMTLTSERNRFNFEQETSEEAWTRLAFGPMLMYDLYEKKQYRISTYGSLLFYPYDKVNISVKSPTIVDERVFKTTSFGAEIGVTFELHKVIKDTVGFLIGTAMNFNLPSTLTSKDGTILSDTWNSGGEDYVKRGFITETHLFMALTAEI